MYSLVKLKLVKLQASPQNFKDLLLRFALFNQRDFGCTVTNCLGQFFSHFGANGLDLLMQDAILPLQLLIAALNLGQLLLQK